MNVRQAIHDHIFKAKEEMISDLRTLVEIPSVMGEAEENAPFGRYPAKALAAALEICAREGFYVRNIGNYIGTAELLPDRPAHLGILCHLDVVPEGSGWSVPPFSLTERDGRLIGRGAIDDKGPAIAAIYAMKTVKALGLPISKNVRLILGTNEENGSADLAYYRERETLPPLLLTPDGSYPLINTEKGMLRIRLECPVSDSRLISLRAGLAVNAVPEKAEAAVRGIAEENVKDAARTLSLPVRFSFSKERDGIRIACTGRSAHASTPETGENALTALFALLSALGIKEAGYFARLFPYGETDGLSCGIKCSDDISGEVTTVLSVGELKDGVLTCRQDVRFPVCESCAGIINRLEKAASACGIAVSADMKSEPHSVPAGSSFVKALLEVYEDVTGERGYPSAIGGGTYVHDTENGVAFGAEFPGEDNHMHGADEFIRTESLLLNAEIYANAIIKLCGKE